MAKNFPSDWVIHSASHYSFIVKILVNFCILKHCEMNEFQDFNLIKFFSIYHNANK